MGLFAKAVEPALTKMKKDIEAADQQFKATQQRLNAALNAPPPPIAVFQPKAPSQLFAQPVYSSAPVQSDLLPEIARMETRQRELRKHGRDLDPAGLEYLSKLRMQYDRLSVR